MHVFEVPSGKLLHEIRTVPAVRGFALAPSGKHFAVAGRLPSSENQQGLGAIQVYALHSGEVIRSFPRKGPDEARMAFFA